MVLMHEFMQKIWHFYQIFSSVRGEFGSRPRSGFRGGEIGIRIWQILNPSSAKILRAQIRRSGGIWCLTCLCDLKLIHLKEYAETSVMVPDPDP